MKNLTLRNLTKVCNGIWHGDDALLDQEISAITTDSRKIEKGCLFVPIVGERVDAHRFIPDVMRKGSACNAFRERTSGCRLCIYSDRIFSAGSQRHCGILSGAASDSGRWNYGKRWKDKYQRSDRLRFERKIPYFENTGKL